ncbi:MAG: glutamate-5-semialdehyde dehydrogenase [Planctomycetes bacterium]|nr:glutamate-5-semialdehyde dehydrogenase [Planctomycetota bacterium]
MDAKQTIEALGRAARAAEGRLATATGAQRDAALHHAAAGIRDAAAELQAANAEDLETARDMDLSDAMIDRLTLTDKRIRAMATALEQIAAQVDPVGETIAGYNRPNGLRIEKRRVPIGVVGIIFESRPNVTADAGGLCIKSGNACILRGGKEALRSNLAIAEVLGDALEKAGLPRQAVTMIGTTDRAIVPAMATAEGLIDVIIPRGGHGLIRAVVQAATLPVIKHYNGNCHVYVHAAADLPMAQAIILNAKCQRPGVCNAAETLLVDAAVAEAFLPGAAKALLKAGVQLRGCERTCGLVDAAMAATDEDWDSEYLDLILAIRVVDGLEEAIDHINAHGSRHTDAIVTADVAAAERFVAAVDASSVMVNASTRFADGGEYGLGAEIGISTDKLHARGPMGAADLTTYKWIVTGNGHIRQ